MKSSLRVCLILLVAAAVALPACKKKKPESEEGAATEGKEAAEPSAGQKEEEMEAPADEAEDMPAAEDDAGEAVEGDAAASDEEEGEADNADQNGEEAAAKPAPKPKGPALTGNLAGSLGGGGIKNGKLKLSITDDYKVHGTIRGKREGQSFLIPVRGSVTKSNQLSADGKRGQSSATIDAKVAPAAVAGKINGKIFGKNFQTRFTVAK